MADDSFGGALGKDNAVHVGGTGETEDHYAEEAIKPGMATTMAGNTGGQVRPANSGQADENFYGTCAVPEGADPDAEVAIGNPAPILKKGSGAVVWMMLKGASGPIPVEGGDIAILSATDGQIEKADETTTPAKTGQVVGVFQHYDPGHATDMHLVRVKI